MKAYDLTFDKTDSAFNISKQFLQGQTGRLYEIRVNESTKDKADNKLNFILVCKLYIRHVNFTK